MRDGNLSIMQVVNNLEIGGAQEVVRTLAENLEKTGCKTIVVTFKDGPLRAGIEQLGIPVEILPRRKHSITALPFFLVELGRTRSALLRLVRKYSVDVIQTHLLRSLDFLVLSLKLETHARIFWTFHNAHFELREEHLARNKWLFRPKLWGYNLLYSLGAHAVNRIIAVSEEVKTSIHQTLPGIPPEKVTTISNSVDVSRYGMQAGRSALRRELGLGEEDVAAAVVATFKEQKGHRFLLDALPEVLREHPRLKVLLIGDGELRTGLQVHAMTLRLEKNIYFLGSRSDVPALLAASDLFILPSLWEGLPMALIEAMATGLPSIATSVSGTNQVMKHGETGLLVAPGDSRELTGAMLKLLSNPESMREMGQAARRRVEIHFGAQRQAQEHLDLFTSELGRLSAVRA